MRPVLATQLCLGAVALVDASAVPIHQQVRRQEGPVPPDTIEACTYFYDSQPGDTCASIARDWGISELQFTIYNPSVKSDCSGLVVGSAYCVEENYGMGPPPPKPTSSTSATSATSRTTTTSTSPTPTGPTPVQSGITTQCKTRSSLPYSDTDWMQVSNTTECKTAIPVPILSTNIIPSPCKTCEFLRCRLGVMDGSVVGKRPLKCCASYSWNPSVGSSESRRSGRV